MEKNLESIKLQIKETVPSKNNALYNSHMYWSQKSYNICDILIEGLSAPGDTIFDPFMGSGVTVLEAIRSKYKRKAYGCEINEAPLSIVKTLTSTYNLSDYVDCSQKLITKINSLKSYYYTKCPYCDGKAYITTTIFDLETRDSNPKIKKINAICNNCKKIEKGFSEADYELMNGPYITEKISIERMCENSKLAVYKDETIDQIFTNRNFKVLDEILIAIEEYPQYKATFKYILMSILHLCKITDTHSNSQWPLWIPKNNCVEKNVVDIFCKKLKKFEDTILYINAEYDNDIDLTLFNKGSQYITEKDIKSHSVDLIITDPPYLGQVAYSEYMQLYKPFLGYDYNMKDEIIVTSTPERKITEEEYFILLDKVFGMCDDKMKPDGYFCMYFHDCNLSTWDKLIKIMAKNHFKYLSQTHIKKTVTLKNIISPKKSLSGDSIIFFIKDEINYKVSNPDESFDSIEKNLINEIVETVRMNGAMTTPELYDNGIVEYLVYNGWLGAVSQKYKTLVEVFERCLKWNAEINRWELN